MTKEDIEFLRDLQHELNTQPNDGNADPVYWGIIEKEKVYTPDGCDVEIVVDGEATYSLEEFIVMLEEDKDDWDFNAIEAWEDVDKDDADAVCDFATDNFGMYVYAECYEYRDKLAQNKFFLTKRYAKEYIERYGYNHNEPRTYAQTAIRNPEFERLLNILKTMDIDKLVVG